MLLHDWDKVLLSANYREQTITVFTHDGVIKAHISPIIRLKDGTSLPNEVDGNTQETVLENAKKQIDFNLSHPDISV